MVTLHTSLTLLRKWCTRTALNTLAFPLTLAFLALFEWNVQNCGHCEHYLIAVWLSFALVQPHRRTVA